MYFQVRLPELDYKPKLIFNFQIWNTKNSF